MGVGVGACPSVDRWLKVNGGFGCGLGFEMSYPMVTDGLIFELNRFFDV